MANYQWKIQGEEKSKYDNIFDSLGPAAGKLSGDKVKPILLNSKLPTDVLGRVWEMSDIDKDGFLDKDEFCVAMHLVYRALEKEPVPSILPQELVPPSKRKPALIGAVSVLPPIPVSTGTGGSPSLVKLPSSFSTVSHQNIPVGLTTDLGGVSLITPTVQSEQTASGLFIKNIVPEIEINRFSAIFAQKSSGSGFIAGPEARDIFVQSELPQTVLAHVWNLCDQQQLGKLNQDQFILAMHYITRRVQGNEVPVRLPPEITLPNTRDSGFSDSGNLSDGSSSGVGDFSAVKELDALNREIEDLRREKEALKSEILEKELVVRKRNNEVQDLQNTLDRASSSLSQLEADKAEAHTRIDDLDQQQLKLDGMIADVRAKVQQETRTIAALQDQIKSQEIANKKQEEEFNKVKKELESLKIEETQLQQTLEIGEQRLSNVNKQVIETEKEIKNVKEQIDRLSEQRKTVSSNIEQYDKAVAALKMETTSVSVSEPSQQFTEAKDDPFSFSDPFDQKHEFETDPFANTSAFGQLSDKATPNDALNPSQLSTKSDPFGSKIDPFFSSGNAFESSGFSNDPFSGSDPFSPDSTTSASPKDEKKSQTKVTDSFKVDFSSSNVSVASSLFEDSEKSKTKTGAGEDMWAAFGGASVGDIANTSTSDPFGKGSFEPKFTDNNDSFGSAFQSESKNNNNASINPSVKSEDMKLEQERKEKMRIQEQLDFEFAVKLSKEL